MQGKNHALTAAATASILIPLLPVPWVEGFFGVILAGVVGLVPDIDEPNSHISQVMPWAGAAGGVSLWGIAGHWQLALEWRSLALLAGMIVLGAIAGELLPHVLKHYLGHRGLIHHPLLGLALLLGSLMLISLGNDPWWLFAAIGWLAHLAGDGITYAGLPWNGKQHLHLLPAPLRFHAGTWIETLVAWGWIILAALITVWLAVSGGVG